MEDQIPEDMKKAIASQLVKSEGQENIVIDKVTELASYIAAIRTPEKYDPSVPFAVVPEFMKTIDLEQNMPHPARIRRDVTFIDVDSFVEYFSRYRKGQQPKIFCRKEDAGMLITAIIDMDIEGRDIYEGDEIKQRVMPLPQWAQHKANLRLKFHEDYAIMRNASGVWLPQREFALFIEQNLPMFVDPVGADMLELAQELRGTRKASWRSGKRLDNNTTSLQYAEDEVEAKGGSISIPQYITLKSPIFEGLDPIEYKAAFSYDILEDHSVSFSIRLLTKLEERRAEEKVKDEVRKRTGEFIYNTAYQI